MRKQSFINEYIKTNKLNAACQKRNNFIFCDFSFTSNCGKFSHVKNGGGKYRRHLQFQFFLSLPMNLLVIIKSYHLFLISVFIIISSQIRRNFSLYLFMKFVFLNRSSTIYKYCICCDAMCVCLQKIRDNI